MYYFNDYIMYESNIQTISMMAYSYYDVKIAFYLFRKSTKIVTYFYEKIEVTMFNESEEWAAIDQTIQNNYNPR